MKYRRLAALIIFVIGATSCKKPVPVDTRDFVGCYYRTGLPVVRIDETSFEIAEAGFVDNDVQFQHMKGRNLVVLSAPFGLENQNGALRFANLSPYTKAKNLIYELSPAGLVIVPFPAGEAVLFAKDACNELRAPE